MLFSATIKLSKGSPTATVRDLTDAELLSYRPLGSVFESLPEYDDTVTDVPQVAPGPS